MSLKEKLEQKHALVDLFSALNVPGMPTLLAVASKQRTGNKKNQNEEEIFSGFGKTPKLAPTKAVSTLLKRTWGATT